MVKRIYMVVFTSRVEVFAESLAGVLDFQTSFTRKDEGIAPPSSYIPDPGLLGISYSDLHAPLEWIEFPLQGASGKLPILTISHKVPRVYVAAVSEPQVRESGDGDVFDSIPDPILGFLLLYPSFRNALDRGDFLTVAHMLVASKELASSHALLRFLAGPEADYPVVWYFLHDQDRDKTAMVESYLSHHRIAEAHEYRVLFVFSNELGLCSSLFEFQERIARLIAQKMRKEGFLWTEVSGLALNVPGLADYLKIVEDVMALEVENRLHNLCTADQFEPRILEKLAHLAPLGVERELLNAYDAQAMAVYATGYNGVRRRVGYVKQDVAHVLCGLGGHFSAQLALLDTDAMEIHIWRKV